MVGGVLHYFELVRYIDLPFCISHGEGVRALVAPMLYFVVSNGLYVVICLNFPCDFLRDCQLVRSLHMWFSSGCNGHMIR